MILAMLQAFTAFDQAAGEWLRTRDVLLNHSYRSSAHAARAKSAAFSSLAQAKGFHY
jgi:hypothetical protein